MARHFRSFGKRGVQGEDGQEGKRVFLTSKDGTSVIVKDLFKDLPVRLTEFKKSYKNQYARALQLLQAYAIIATESKLSVAYNLGEKQ